MFHFGSNVDDAVAPLTKKFQTTIDHLVAVGVLCELCRICSRREQAPLTIGWSQGGGNQVEQTLVEQCVSVAGAISSWSKCNVI